MQDAFLALGRKLVDLDLAGADHIEAEGLLALGEEQVSALVLAQAADLQQPFEIVVGDAGEEGAVFDDATRFHRREPQQLAKG